MTERKYQIFISSSYKDLQNERKALIEQILRAGHIPSGMEMFTAGDTEEFEVIKRAIDQCDIYVVLIGSRFGSFNPKTGQSFTEMEFDYASGIGKPILAFLKEDEEFKEERDLIKAEDPERKYEDKLRAFREKVKQIGKTNGERLVDFFTKRDIGALKADFLMALDGLIKDPGFKRHGWVPGELYESIRPLTRLGEDIHRNKFIRKIVNKLNEYHILSERCTDREPLAKEVMASYFWDYYLAKIVELGIKNLFFESGSTIVYLSTEFSSRLEEPAGGKLISEWRIFTNNILTYLEFVLFRNIHVDLVPFGPPDETYGATFGEIASLVKYPPPEEPRKLTKAEKEAVEKLANQLLPDKDTSLFLATASGIDLDKNSTFPGPHVGSYYNKLVKRAILSANCPVVLFLDESKVPYPFIVGRCFPVCDPDKTWDEVCKSVPLALCIGTSTQEKREEVIKEIEPFGFNPITIAREYKKHWPLMASNNLFHERFK